MPKPITAHWVTARYDSGDAAQNVVDELVAAGIPREKIKRDEEKNEVSVMTPHTEKPELEIEEVLKRHDPVELRE